MAQSVSKKLDLIVKRLARKSRQSRKDDWFELYSQSQHLAQAKFKYRPTDGGIQPPTNFGFVFCGEVLNL